MLARRLSSTLQRLSLAFPVVAITGPRQSGKTTLARALFADQESLAKAYDALATALPENGYVCEQSAMTKPDAYEKAWCQALTDVVFEGETFKAPAEYDKFLTTLYGDYMQLPPENERENRHQIMQIDFGD